MCSGSQLIFCVVREHFVFEIARANEPTLPRILNERILFGPPTERVVVQIFFSMKQQPALLQIANDVFVAIFHPATAAILRSFVGEFAIRTDALMSFGTIAVSEILLVLLTSTSKSTSPKAGADVNNAGAAVGRNEIRRPTTRQCNDICLVQPSRRHVRIALLRRRLSIVAIKRRPVARDQSSSSSLYVDLMHDFASSCFDFVAQMCFDATTSSSPQSIVVRLAIVVVATTAYSNPDSRPRTDCSATSKASSSTRAATCSRNRFVDFHPSSGNFTYTLGSATCRYPSPTSPAESAVPPCAHHHTILWP